MNDNLKELAKTLNRMLKKLDTDSERERIIEQIPEGATNEYYIKGACSDRCNCGHVRYIDNAYPVKVFPTRETGNNEGTITQHKIENQ